MERRLNADDRRFIASWFGNMCPTGQSFYLAKTCLHLWVILISERNIITRSRIAQVVLQTSVLISGGAEGGVPEELKEVFEGILERWIRGNDPGAYGMIGMMPAGEKKNAVLNAVKHLRGLKLPMAD